MWLILAGTVLLVLIYGRDRLDQRIATLTRLRDNLDGCIGCGCLSLPKCALYNPDDRAKCHGSGPRYLMGDAPEE